MFFYDIFILYINNMLKFFIFFIFNCIHNCFPIIYCFLSSLFNIQSS